MRRGAAGAALLVLAGLAVPHGAGAQTVGAGVDYMGYEFGDGLNAKSAQLFMIPVAVRYPIKAVRLDLFGAWAEGRVRQGSRTLKLSGLVDTSLKGSWSVTPWAQIGVGINIPTGNATHDDDEAIVASVLSTDLLGFREATWGTGFAVTTSAAVARRAGGFGVGIAGAYAARGSFEPAEGQTLSYQPGNEARVRAGVDYNFGNSTLTTGVTFINYAEDRYTDELVSDRNLFQAGNRVRIDATYAFRAGAGVWSLYAADLIRSNGDLRVDVIDDTGITVGETSIVTAKQNLFVGGVMGTVGLGGGYVFRPHVEYKLQSRTEADGNEAGSGWILSGGGDLPLRLFGGPDFFPKARVFWGSVRDATGGHVRLLGLEFKGTLRINF